MENRPVPITDLDGCRQVVAVQHDVWGMDDEIVPASLLLVSVKTGGILLGVFDQAQLVGFVWSLPAWRDRQPMHWSHMLAVRPSWRGRGLGELLKQEQRRRALAQDIHVIEWTFDPLQTINAHLNLARLGVVASTYLYDLYGASPSPLHSGTPTDRLVAHWALDEPHVERRLQSAPHAMMLHARDAEVLSAPVAIETHTAGDWLACSDPQTALDVPRVLIPIPPRFTEMQQQARLIALAWRTSTRAAFTSYFARGYRCVDFFLDRERGGGRYLLAKA